MSWGPSSVDGTRGRAAEELREAERARRETLAESSTNSRAPRTTSIPPGGAGASQTPLAVAPPSVKDVPSASDT